MLSVSPTKKCFARVLLLALSTLLVGGLVAGCSEDDPASPANRAPVAAEDDYYVIRGATLTAADAEGTAGGAEDDGVLANDTDADGDALTAVLVAAPINHVGSFTLNADGTFTYIHDGSAFPGDSFTYLANDGEENSGEVTVTIRGPVVAEDSDFGSETITRDLATGLRWLDVTLSTPYSYDQLLPELDAGGVFAGYRLATGHEVKSFWAHAGVDTTLTGFVTENFQPVVDLMAFVGITGTNGNMGGGNFFDFTVGHVESGPGGGTVFVYTLAADPDPTLTGRQSNGTVPSDNTNSGHGAWLVEL